MKTATPPRGNAVGEHDFRNALRNFASGVTVITTSDEASTVHGMTATAFCSLSLRPPLVLVAVARGARCHELILTQRRFGVSILHENQTAVSRHYGGQKSKDVTPRFRMLDGLPVLEEAMATLACTLEAPLEGGDHSIFTGLVTAARAGQGHPLIHFGGRYRTLSKP